MAESESVKAVLSNSLPLLKINFGANEIKEPGEKLSREVAASEPTVAYNSSGMANTSSSTSTSTLHSLLSPS